MLKNALPSIASRTACGSVPEKNYIIDPSEFSLDNEVLSRDEMLRHIPQRFEMLQIDAIVYDNAEQGICVGRCELRDDAFWVRGHMPGSPLMPGVLMCEAAAQVCTFHAMRHKLMHAEMIGFGALDAVKFREMVFPGDRLAVVAQKVAVRPTAMIRSRFQCLVGDAVACEGEIRGIPIPVEALQGRGH